MKTISEVQIVPVKPNNGLVAFCSFVLFESLYCSSVAVFTRPGGAYRLVYPTKVVIGREMQIFHPISRELGSKIEKEVTNKLMKMVGNGGYCSTDN
jgi:DNA-binding cell septation regulator SpoVG